MMLHYLAALAWSIGLLVSPENLILVGNIAGSSGTGALVLLAATAFLFRLLAGRYRKLLENRPPAVAEIDLMSTLFGKIPATVLALGGRIWLSVCMATAVLVAAGFVFNEVFFHRFPNFAFAFLLLGFILTVHLWQPGWVQVVQTLLVVLAFGGLAVLAVAGLLYWLKNPQILLDPFFSIPVNRLAGILLVFVGFEVLLYTHNSRAADPLLSYRQLAAVLFLTTGLFSIWAMASLAAVGPERLQDTTIPHILAARKIMGQTGRMIMGLVIIAGSAAAVNALFTATSRLVAHTGRHLVAGLGAGNQRKQALVAFILLASATATAMAAGLAGSEILNSYLKGGLILWLLNYACLCAAMLSGATRLHGGFNPVAGGFETFKTVALLLILGGAGLALIWTDENSGLIVLSMAGAASVVSLLSGLGYAFDRFQRPKR